MPRLPFDGSPRVSCDAACHQRRKPPSTGEDWGMAVGTNLYAPFDGTMRFRSAGTGGWTVTITASDARLQGLVVELMHLSAAIGLGLGDSRPVVEGEHVAESGGAKGHPGAGNSTGPHLHGHGILHGARIPLTQAIAWANEQTPEQEHDMAQGAFYRNKSSGAIFWQEKPNTVLTPIDLPTWVAYAANGNKYADLEATQVSALIAKWGQVERPATGSGGGASANDIGAAVDAALKDDFATINASINKPRTIQ